MVAGGGGDNAASAIGMGTVAEGQAFISIGTSGVVFAANQAYLPNPESAVHAFCHAVPERWHQMGGYSFGGRFDDMVGQSMWYERKGINGRFGSTA